MPGTPGLPGPKGPRGFPGLDRAKGNAGELGEKEDERSPMDSPISPMEPPGPLGPAGPRVERGREGPSGPPGLRGVDGITGSLGSPGAIGKPGPPEFPGTPGSKGDMGATGPKGSPGLQDTRGMIILICVLIKKIYKYLIVLIWNRGITIFVTISLPAEISGRNSKIMAQTTNAWNCSKWGDWGQCSESCGKGFRERVRAKIDESSCLLKERKQCQIRNNNCEPIPGTQGNLQPISLNSV